MKCPSCAMPLEAPAPRCPHCRMTMQKLDLRFGLVPAHSRLLSDRSETLTLPELKQLREKLRLFKRRFPQILLSIFVTELSSGASVSEFAFWMANRARFASSEKTREENFNILFVIDVGNGAAAITTGYGLEAYVPESTLSGVLDAFVNQNNADGVASGIDAAIDFITEQLRELAVKAKAEQLEEARHGSETW